MNRLSHTCKPTFSGQRPLLGLTILLVEDSRCCAQGVRMLSVRSGARLRRADSLKSARRHLAIYRPDVLIVDLGLPDGSGVDLIGEVSGAVDWAPKTIALSGDDGGPGRAEAMEAGALCFLTKPLQDITYFQQVILSLTYPEGAPYLRVARSDAPRLKVDGRAFVDDLKLAERHLRQALSAADTTQLRYLAQFTRSVGKTAQDHELVDCAAAFGARLVGGEKWRDGGGRVLALLQNRLKDVAPI